jgi:hypothetical protein
MSNLDSYSPFAVCCRRSCPDGGSAQMAQERAQVLDIIFGLCFPLQREDTLLLAVQAGIYFEAGGTSTA